MNSNFIKFNELLVLYPAECLYLVFFVHIQNGNITLQWGVLAALGGVASSSEVFLDICFSWPLCFLIFFFSSFKNIGLTMLYLCQQNRFDIYYRCTMDAIKDILLGVANASTILLHGHCLECISYIASVVGKDKFANDADEVMVPWNFLL